MNITEFLAIVAFVVLYVALGFTICDQVERVQKGLSIKVSRTDLIGQAAAWTVIWPVLLLYVPLRLTGAALFRGESVSGNFKAIYHAWRGRDHLWNWQHADERIILENRTPHPVTILGDHVNGLLPGRETVTLKPAGDPIRLDQEDWRMHGTVFECNAGAEDFTICLGSLACGSADLPEREPNRVLIVSAVVALAFPERDDLVFPADFVRDEEGRITGCKKLVRPRS